LRRYSEMVDFINDLKDRIVALEAKVAESEAHDE